MAPASSGDSEFSELSQLLRLRLQIAALPRRVRGALAFSSALELIGPSVVGIREWVVGQASQYRVTEKGELGSRTLDVEVLRQAGPSDKYFLDSGARFMGQYWVLFSDIDRFRSVQTDWYNLVTPSRLAASPSTPSFEYSKNYFPIWRGVPTFDVTGCYVGQLGTEFITTEGFEGHCTKLGIHDDRGQIMGTVWMHPGVAPLGVVRYESGIDLVELIAQQVREGDSSKLVSGSVEAIRHLLQGASSLIHGCGSCHDSFEGGGQLLTPPR